MDTTHALLMATAIFCVAVQVKAHHPLDPTLMEQGMEKVGDYLSENVGPSGDLDADFAASEKLLGELSQKSFFFPSTRVKALEKLLSLRGKMTECSPADYELFGEVKKDSRRSPRAWSMANLAYKKHNATCDELQITALKERANDCSLEEFKLFNTKQKEWERDHKEWTKISSEAIVRADNCLDKQANKIAKEMETVDPQTLALVRRYTDLTLKYIRALRPDDNIVDLIASKMRTSNNVHYHQQLWDMLYSQAKDDLKEGKEKFRTQQMCSSYIIEPCKAFNERLSNDFNLWERITDYSRKKYDDSYLKTNTDFYRYLICEYIKWDGKSVLITTMDKIRPIE